MQEYAEWVQRFERMRASQRCGMGEGLPAWRSDMHTGEFDRQVRHHDDHRLANIGKVLISQGSLCRAIDTVVPKSFRSLKKLQRKTLAMTGGIILICYCVPPYTNGTMTDNGL
jgi:hypothetical protein